MKTFLAVAAALSLGAIELASHYEAETSYRVTRSSKFVMETTGVEMERDGEPIESPGRFGGGGTSASKEVVYVDHVLEASDGVPMAVRREFETLNGEASRFEQDVDLNSPFAGAVVLLSSDAEGEVSAEVEDGSVPDEALELLRLEIVLDALLPEDPDADEWEIESDALKQALGLDLGFLWEQPEFESRGRGGGGRRGRGFQGVHHYLGVVDWSASAELADDVEEIEGVDCRIVRVVADGSGVIEPRDGPMQSETEFEVELEGTLAFAVEARRPLRFEIEATLDVESVSEFERGDVSMHIERTMEGRYEQALTLSAHGE